MFKKYLKVVLRNLKRQKAYSFINISGLTIGMTCCIVILLFVQDELSYDRFHENSQRIYRLATEMISHSGKEGSTKTWSWMAPNMINDFPEVINAVRIYRYGAVLSYGKKYFGQALFFVDPSMLDIFTFPLVRGDKQTALKDPDSALITEELAEKYFGDEDPLEKVLTVYGKYNFKIKGVLRNIPQNSHFRFDFLASFDQLRNIYGEEEYQKGLLVRTYLLLDKNASRKRLERKFHNFVIKYKGGKFAAAHKYFLQPLTSIHLHSDLAVELGKNSDIAYSYALSGVALIILIIACINFMNLSTARASWRSKEVGIRKVIGASRLQLFRQFIGESVFFSFLALIVAIVLSELVLPFFNSLVGKDLSINFRGNLPLYTGLILLTLFVGFVSGSYPAIFLSSFQPVEVLKGNLRKSALRGVLFRKGLVIFQFSISLIFIIGAIIIFRQVNFIKNRNIGFDKGYVISLSIDKTIRKRYETIKTELLKSPNIASITASMTSPGINAGLRAPFVPEGFQDNEEVTLYLCDVDHNFFEFFGIDIVEGRNFSKEITSDVKSAFILNEAAVKKIGWKSPIGKRIKCEGYGVKGVVVGVVRNFHNVSLHEEIKPSIFRVNPQYFPVFARIRPDNIQRTISFIEEKMREFSPQLIFRYSFLEDDITALYREEKKMNQVFGFSSLLSIIIACLGLFGLASFSVEQRIKEIGIRKVLGASVANILLLLSKEFIRLVIIANVIGWPVAYFVMNRWLQDFAYRIDIGIGTFILAAILAIVITTFTISSQAVKAARANPVETLRYE